MKPTEQQKKKVSKWIRKWRGLLFLNMWNFDIVWGDTIPGLEITMQPEYKNALIEINIQNWNKMKDDKEREESILHELCHCVIQPLVNLACEGANGRQVSQAEMDWFKEDLTQHITRIIYCK